MARTRSWATTGSVGIRMWSDSVIPRCPQSTPTKASSSTRSAQPANRAQYDAGGEVDAGLAERAIALAVRAIASVQAVVK